MKTRLLIFLVLSRYGLACKYRIISQISYIIGCRIAFYDISGIAFSCYKDQITTQSLSQLVEASQMVCHMMSLEQYHQLR